MKDLQTRLEGIEPNDQGIIPVAYIGVSGERYRVRVPVQKIVVTPREGSHVALGPQTFDKWHGPNWFLLTRSKHAPSGGAYDKFDFEVTWANGQTYSGRYDLRNDVIWPQVEKQIENHLRFYVEKRPEWVKPEQIEAAERMLIELDMGQNSPSPAPVDWPVIRDYRTEKVGAEEPSLDRQVYDAVAARDAAPEAPAP